MHHSSGSLKKNQASLRQTWLRVLRASLFLFWLALLAVCASFFACVYPAFAAQISFSRNMFTTSPRQGPIGAVIAVNGTNVFYPDGTQIRPGYTTDFRSCHMPAESQSGLVQNRAFNAWFRWPATGTGNFGVCISANGFPAVQVGSYRVLSASAPSLTVMPGTLNAGKQATVTGANFLPGGTTVGLVWRAAQGGESTSLGQVTANNAGSFSKTFTVPAHASTGTYTLTGIGGSGSPPTLSALATFPVNGITIAAVPTPTVQPSPTATVAPVTTPKTIPATVSSHGTVLSTQTSGNTTGKTSLLLAIGLSGGLLIILALGTGIVIVRRQRVLALQTMTGPGGPSWFNAPTISASPPWRGRGAVHPAGEFAVSPADQATAIIRHTPSPGPGPVPMFHDGQTRVEALPFDPGLAEALREAQVSLFAMPRPPRGNEAEAR